MSKSEIRALGSKRPSKLDLMSLMAIAICASILLGMGM